MTFHGCVTCQFAMLFHCDLHESDMSRKKRDAFCCTGAAFCEIRSLLRSSIGISVWRVVFLVLDVAVPLGFAFQGVASKLCFRDKSQLKCRFWWMGVCSERVEIIPNVWCGANFVEAHMRWYCHFSWQAQYFVRILRCGSAIFVAGAGNREVARCDISWQAQYFVRVRRVDAERFVGEVVSCGRGECRSHTGIGVVLFGGAGLAKLLGRAA